jgi:TonB family protein
VEGCSAVLVIARNGARRIALVEARDRENDLALLNLNSTLEFVAMFRSTPARAGEDVIALGFPLRGLLADELNVSKGIVSATAGLLNDPSELQVSAAVQPGNSGGPLLDASAAVAGVIVARLDGIAVARMTGVIPENVNFAIKAEVAEAFLRMNGVIPLRRRATTSQPLGIPETVDRARRYIFAVECDPDQPTAYRAPEPVQPKDVPAPPSGGVIFPVPSRVQPKHVPPPRIFPVPSVVQPKDVPPPRSSGVIFPVPSGGVMLPSLVREVMPEYTSEALRLGIEGTVVVECLVLPDGTVGKVEVVRSLDPSFGLDEQAVKAAKQWRFKPGTRFGEPVAVLVTLEMTFKVRRSQ